MRNNQKVNPFLLQRQINQTVRSLSKDKRKLVGQAYINVLNDAKCMPLHVFKCKYFGSKEDQ